MLCSSFRFAGRISTPFVKRCFAVVTRFSKEHEWIVFDDQTNLGKVGITDFAQSELGDLVYVDAGNVGDEYSKMDSFGTLESVKGVAELYIPVSGEVTEINSEILDDPSLLNSNPTESWIIEMKLSAPEEVAELMDEKQYAAYLIKLKEE